MKISLSLFSALTIFFSPVSAFTVHQLGLNNPRAQRVSLYMSKVGIFFGTSTGSTETVADLIKEQFGDDAEGPFDVDADPLTESVLNKYEAVIVGTPTWNTGKWFPVYLLASSTVCIVSPSLNNSNHDYSLNIALHCIALLLLLSGADSQRSGTGWDELYGDFEGLDLTVKKVAVFGLGDQISYAENYADATGELHDVFESLGCKMFGYTSQEGYEHEDSKSIRGDKFCGLLCDMVNQEELTEERVEKWVAQLREEGFLEGGAGSVRSSSEAEEAPAAEVATAVAASTSSNSMEEIIKKLEQENAALRSQLEQTSLNKLDENSALLDQSIASHSTGYTPHYNPVSGRTMWTSADGRSCYYTSETKTVSTKATRMSP